MRFYLEIVIDKENLNEEGKSINDFDFNGLKEHMEKFDLHLKVKRLIRDSVFM